MKKNVLTSSARASLSKALFSGGLLSGGLLMVGVLPAPAAPAKPTNPAAAVRSSTPAPATSAATAPAAKPVPNVAITNIEVAAEVGSEKIAMADVNRLVQAIVEQHPELAENTPKAQGMLKQVRDDIVDNMIAQRLLLQEAQHRNLMPAKEKVDEAVWDFQKSFDKPSDFEKWLSDEHKTTDDLRTLLANRLAVEALKKQVIANVALTDVDLNNFYNEHKAEFAIPETVSVRDIRFAIPKDASADDKKKLMQKAQGVLKKATASSADFAALAKENSDDKATAARGGDMGLLTREDVVDEAFAEAIFNAPVGKVYPKVIETKLVYAQVYNKETGRLEDGTVEAPAFHIIKVEDKKPGRTLSLTEVTDDIKPFVLEDKRKTVLDNYVADLRKKAAVKKYI